MFDNLLAYVKAYTVDPVNNNPKKSVLFALIFGVAFGTFGWGAARWLLGLFS